MRGITRRWKLAETHHPCDEHSLLERLLCVRGISKDEKKDFLEPTMAQTHDPGLLPGIDEAATLLVDAGGVVRWIDQSTDYQVRSNPERVLGALSEHLPA